MLGWLSWAHSSRFRSPNKKKKKCLGNCFLCFSTYSDLLGTDIKLQQVNTARPVRFFSFPIAMCVLFCGCVSTRVERHKVRNKQSDRCHRQALYACVRAFFVQLIFDAMLNFFMDADIFPSRLFETTLSVSLLPSQFLRGSCKTI